MDLLAAALLGIVQGLTEFLPVSSSGHLILARAFFGWDAGRFGLAFDVACHVGTLLAVVGVFPSRCRGDDRGAAGGADAGATDRRERLVRLIVVGTLPIVVVGLAVRQIGIETRALAGGRCGDAGAGRRGAPRRRARWVRRARTKTAVGYGRSVRDWLRAGVGADPGDFALGRDADAGAAARVAARVGGAVRVPAEPARGAGRGGARRSWICRKSASPGCR